MEELEDPSGRGFYCSMFVIAVILIGITYLKLGWDGIKMIAIFLPIFPAIFWLSDRWGRIDN